MKVKHLRLSLKESRRWSSRRFGGLFGCWLMLCGFVWPTAASSPVVLGDFKAGERSGFVSVQRFETNKNTFITVAVNKTSADDISRNQVDVWALVSNGSCLALSHRYPLQGERPNELTKGKNATSYIVFEFQNEKSKPITAVVLRYDGSHFIFPLEGSGR
jgi:hypothetical protein